MLVPSLTPEVLTPSSCFWLAQQN